MITGFEFISTQLCALMLSGLLWFLIITKKRLKTHSLISYKLLLASTTIMTVLDMATATLLYFHHTISPTLLFTITKLYLVSILMTSYMGLNYFTSELYQREKFNIYRLRYGILFALESIIIFSASIGVDENGIYTDGMATHFCYIFTFITMTIIVINNKLYGKYISKARQTNTMIWMGIWFISAFIEGISQNWIIVSFGTTLGLFFIYTEIENPSNFLDYETNLYNMRAIREYAGIQIKKKKNMYGILIKLNTFSKNLSIKDSFQLNLMIANFFEKDKYALPFRMDSYTYIVLMPQKYIDETLDKYIQFFNELDNKVYAFNGIGVGYAVVKEDNTLVSLEDTINTFYYLKSLKNDNEIVNVTHDFIASIKQNEIMKEEIQKALTDRRIKVFYQPIYDAKTHKFISAEALVRMFDEEGNIVPPNKFIPVAEESGLIIPLGEYIFEEVCRVIKEENLTDISVKYIEINLSAIQCEHPDLYETFSDIMERYNINSKQINFEITESIQTSSKAISKNINKFLKMGIAFSLDDFGTGNSNLDYIATMPIDIVKFDYKMTQAYFKNIKARTILKHTVAMVKELGLEIVGEGVETKEQLDTMINLGIDHIQGFYFSKPLPEEDYVKFVKENNTKTVEE